MTPATEPIGPAPPDPASSWTCPACGAERAADDGFCGRCGGPRPAPATPDAPTTDRDRGFSIRRTLILNGVLLGAVLLAVAFGTNGGPAAITFEPATWRCDGTERAWTASVPARATDLRIEWRRGGPEGELLGTATTTRLALEPFAGSDAAFRVPETGSARPECALEPGTYTMAIRDAVSNALLATGDVALAAPPP